MAKFKLAFIPSFLFLVVGSGSDSVVDLVKDGNMDNCP